MSLINLSALWKIVVFGLLAGAGLPAIFAVGLLSLSRGPKTRTAGADSEAVVGGSLAGMIIAAVCFLAVLAAIGWGIHEVHRIRHPAPPEEPGQRSAAPRPPVFYPKRSALLRGGYRLLHRPFSG